MNRGAKTGEQEPATKYGPTNFCQKRQLVSEYSKSGGLANPTLKEEPYLKGPMKLINSNSGQMECRICGSQHWACIRPGGGYHRCTWQCPKGRCPSNRNRWSVELQRFVKPNWRTVSTTIATTQSS